MIHVVVLNGLPENGKDTFREYCADFCKKNGAEVMYRSSIEVPKEILRTYFGWAGDSHKNEFWRAALSELKAFWVKTCDGPTKFCLDNIVKLNSICKDTDEVSTQLTHWLTTGHTPQFDSINHLAMKDGFFFTDIREPAEISKLQEAINNVTSFDVDCSTVFIVRPGKHKVWNNPSDDLVAEFTYDYTIDNSSVEIALSEKAERTIQNIINRSHRKRSL